MFNWLVFLVAGLFFLLGLYFLLVKEFREPTFWKLYFPPFYEKSPASEKLLVYRRLKSAVKIALGWYFLAAGVLIFLLLVLLNW